MVGPLPSLKIPMEMMANLPCDGVAYASATPGGPSESD